MFEMQNLVAHPRIQQKTWVARAKEWLPLLQIVHGEMIATPDEGKRRADPSSILVEVNAGGEQTFINLALAEVQQIEVCRGNEPGYRHVRGAHSGFVLKDGRKFLTSADEAQRIVDAMRQQ